MRALFATLALAALAACTGPIASLPPVHHPLTAPDVRSSEPAQ